jgi:hypothetical protein
MEGESSTSTGNVSPETATTGSTSQSAPEVGNSTPVTADKVESQSTGQAQGQSGQPAQGQAGQPQLDTEMQTWMQSKGITLDTISQDPVKYLQMYRNAESHFGKQINDLKTQYEQQKRLETAKAVAPETEPEAPKKPSESITSKYETAVGNILYVFGVEDVNQLIQNFPQEQYPAIYQKLHDISREFQTEYQKALAQDVEFLIGNQNKVNEKQTAEQQFQKEWDGIKNTVNTKFDSLRKENPQIDNQLQSSGVKNVVKKLSEYIGVPEEYLWHDAQMFDFFRQAATAIEFKKDVPNIEAKWKQDALKQFQQQKQVEMPSASDGFNFAKAHRMGKGVSLLD